MRLYFVKEHGRALSRRSRKGLLAPSNADPESPRYRKHMSSKISPWAPEVFQKGIRIHHPLHTYLHLTLISTPAITLSPNSSHHDRLSEVDVLTARSCLSSALQQYLGLAGAAITVDVLKVEGRDCWIRVPIEDKLATVGALGQWTSNKDGGVAWRIRHEGEWWGMVAAGDGNVLFQP